MDQHNIAVEIKHLSKRVKKKELLKPFDYQLFKGKTLALCGGNGAGKSTLLRLIIGLLKPTTGRVEVSGLNGRETKHGLSNQFGYMPDDFHFQKSLTANEIIHFYAKMKHVSKARYEEKIAEVGLSDKLNEHVGKFSKGMNQRLLLAQSLLTNPDILILDEPTNGLDPYWVQQFSKLMLHAKENGQTIIFSTHDLHVVEHIADEVLFLHEGEVIEQGPINRYRNHGLHQTFEDLYFKEIEKNLTKG